VSSQACTVGVNIIHIVYCQQPLQHLLVLIIGLIITLHHKVGKHYLQLQALQQELHFGKQADQHSQWHAHSQDQDLFACMTTAW